MTQTLNVIHVAYEATTWRMHGSTCIVAVPPYLVNDNLDRSGKGLV